MMDLRLDQLRTLTALLDGGTFEAAARIMRVTPSAVSQRVKALEQQVGRILVQRTKPVRLTDSGEVLQGLARQLELLEAEATTALGSGMGMTRLSIVTNADSLDTWVIPALATVEGVSFDLRREDQGHSTDLLRDGTVLAAITSDPEPVQGCTVSSLGAMTYRPLAALGFRERWPSFADAPIVTFDRKDQLQDDYLRTRGIDSAVPPRHYVPASHAFLDAVVHGLGWGMLPDQQSQPLLRSGSLVELDPGAHVSVPLYWQQWAIDSDALTRVATALRRTLAEATSDRR